MARYRIEESGSAVNIEVTEVGGKREDLLGAFGACQAGQCSCPTDEYQKLAAMNVEHGEDDILLRLEPKPGAVRPLGNCRVSGLHDGCGEDQSFE